MSHPEFPPLGRYRHFKGGEYLLVDFARHSETQEWMVVYRALYGNGGLWVRPAAMWADQVNTADGPVPRFRRMEEAEAADAAENEQHE